MGPLRFGSELLESEVRAELGKSAGQPILYADVCSLYSLSLQSEQFTIASLSGLECLDHLQTLAVEQVATPDLSSIANLSELSQLRLSNVVGASNLAPIAELPDLMSLSLGAANPNDLSVLAKLPHLTELALRSSTLPELFPLASFPALASLDLSSSDAADLDGFGANENLRALDLSKTGISDLSSLARLRNVTSLRLVEDPITDLTPLLGIFAPGALLELNGVALDCHVQAPSWARSGSVASVFGPFRAAREESGRTRVPRPSRWSASRFESAPQRYSLRSFDLQAPNRACFARAVKALDIGELACRTMFDS